MEIDVSTAAAIGALGATALNWFVSKAHGNDSGAHSSQFKAISEAQAAGFKALTERLDRQSLSVSERFQTSNQQVVDSIVSHGRDSEAHSGADRRISNLENDMAHIRGDLIDIKTMLRLLTEKREATIS